MTPFEKALDLYANAMREFRGEHRRAEGLRIELALSRRQVADLQETVLGLEQEVSNLALTNPRVAVYHDERGDDAE